MAPKPPIERGQVYRLKGRAGHVVVVSNDLRNAALPTVLVARLTTVPKPPLPTIVDLPVGEPAVGRVVCDQLAEMPASVLGTPAGSLSRAAMRAIDEGLRISLGLG